MSSERDKDRDRGAAEYELWYPRWDLHEGTVRCRFEAVTAGLRQLHEGTAECMAEFLADLDHPGAEIRSWSISRYVTPSLALAPGSDVLESRLALTWSVEVHTTTEGDPDDIGEHGPGPHVSRAFDPTFVDISENWDRSSDRVLVLVGLPFGEEPDASVWQGSDLVEAVHEDFFEGMLVLDLGALDLPTQLPRIDAVLERCEELRLNAHFEESSTAVLDWLQPPS